MKTLLNVLSVLAVTACASLPQPAPQAEPEWKGKVYVGDAGRQALVRAQAGEAIACADPAFSGVICLTADDFTALLGKLKFYRETCGVNRGE